MIEAPTTIIILAILLANTCMTLFVAWVIYITHDRADDKAARLAALILCLILNSIYIGYLECRNKVPPPVTIIAEPVK